MEEGEISDTVETEAPADEDAEERGIRIFHFENLIYFSTGNVRCKKEKIE